MTHGSSPSQFLADERPLRRMALPAVLVLSCLILTILITLVIARQPPSFDGAMNLQVAWSLSNGEGYQRSYADRTVFPKEVQTNAPYVVPAAVFYHLLGVGYASSQLTNLIYFYVLLLTCYMLVRREYSASAAALAVIAVLVTPGIMTFGFNGYGEIPALAWALLSLFFFTSRESWGRLALAGLCLGLAVCTKTVMAICAFAFGAGYVAILLFQPRTAPSLKAFRIALLIAAALMPVLLVEAWRYMSLGGLGEFRAWWETSFASINRQAGTQAGFQDTRELSAKISTHLGLLGGMLGLSTPLLVAWLVGPFLILPLFLVREGWSRKSLAIGLPLAAAGIYLVWWLALTPTQKAWHRRILDGVVLLNLCWVWAGALIFTWLSGRNRTAAWGAGALMLASAGALFGQFFKHDLQKELASHPEHPDLERAIATVRGLPRDAVILGIGWDSAPVISLLSGRPFEDVNNVPISSLQGKKTYFVTDNTTAAADVDTIVGTYRSTPLGSGDSPYRIYHVDFGVPADRLSSPPSNDVAWLPRVLDTRTATDTATAGFYGLERDGAWMSSDAYMRLRYTSGSQLGLRAYLPDLGLYTKQGKPISISASIDGCPLHPIRLAKGGLQEIWFEVPSQCMPEDGESALVRISSDGLIVNSITRDDRALFAKVPLVGFAQPGLLEQVSDSDASEDKARNEDVSWMRVEPIPGSFCHGGREVFAARVRWRAQAGVNPHGGMHVWVSHGDAAPKLWVSSGAMQGDATTGEWVREGTRFALRSGSGKELASASAPAPFCPQG